MSNSTIPKAPGFLVALAFAIVFLVWGSTYFFIRMAVLGFPPMLMGAVRYCFAGAIMLAWCKAKGDRLFVAKDMLHAAVAGFMMLFLATGILMWVERTLPSSLVAIVVSSNPVWFIILDKANWRVNLKNKSVVSGLLLGLAGIILLFGQSLAKTFSAGSGQPVSWTLILLIAGPIAWSAGALYSKKHMTNTPARLATSWQMIFSGLAFIPASLFHHEFSAFSLRTVPLQSWLAIAYLIVFGSIAAFTAYIWLLQVRTAAEVSIHSYVNPIVAVLLGVCFAGEMVTSMQIAGFIVILFSVLLVNLHKYRVFLPPHSLFTKRVAAGNQYQGQVSAKSHPAAAPLQSN